MSHSIETIIIYTGYHGTAFNVSHRVVIHLSVFVFGSCSMTKVFKTSAKSLDSGQPAQSAQADLNRDFLLFVVYLKHTLFCQLKWGWTTSSIILESVLPLQQYSFKVNLLTMTMKECIITNMMRKKVRSTA